MGAMCTNRQKVQVEFQERLAQEVLKFQQAQKLKDAALGKTQRMLNEIEELKTTQEAQAAEDFLMEKTLRSFCLKISGRRRRRRRRRR